MMKCELRLREVVLVGFGSCDVIAKGLMWMRSQIDSVCGMRSKEDSGQNTRKYLRGREGN